MKKELVVVQPTLPDEAKQKFKDWMSSNTQLVESLGKEDIVIDLIKGSDGAELCRYRVFLPEG